MMFPTDFDESNAVLGKPEDMTDEECTPLCVLRAKFAGGEPFVLSCWKLTQEELDEINKSGKVWLMVFGTGMPPVALTSIKPI
jgi:hypothetical protein